MTIGYILCSFGTFFSGLGNIYQEKSGNPASSASGSGRLNAEKIHEKKEIHFCLHFRFRFNPFSAQFSRNFFSLSPLSALPSAQGYRKTEACAKITRAS
jgi:hypothetical protein